MTFVASPSDPRAHRFTVTDSAGRDRQRARPERAWRDGQRLCRRLGRDPGAHAGRSLLRLPPAGARLAGGRLLRRGLRRQRPARRGAAHGGPARSTANRSGLEIVVGKCTLGANWVVSDGGEAFVVESIPADQEGRARYAVRRPGDMGEKDGRYIVSTNNVEAADSWDEDNVHDPDHPMRQHGNGGAASHALRAELDGHALLDVHGAHRAQPTATSTSTLVQQWRTTHFVLDRDGTRHERLGGGRPARCPSTWRPAPRRSAGTPSIRPASTR